MENTKIGIDLVEVERFKSQPARFYEKLFTKNEIAYCTSFLKPAQHFAGHFAAKEAVMKALGMGLDTILFSDIEVCHTPEKAPFVKLYGSASLIAKSKKLSIFEISISHTSTSATAICLAH